MIDTGDRTRRREVLAALALLGLTAACGRKPAAVDPPEGVVVDTFPRRYPPDDDEDEG